ncbi:MAG: hypothetical protein AAGG46_07645, partial [Planctomycetota bacterium]
LPFEPRRAAKPEAVADDRVRQQDRPPSGVVWLACDLTGSPTAGRSLAASIALDGALERAVQKNDTLLDDNALVIATRPLLRGATPSPELVEANEPGLFSCRFAFHGTVADRRRLLVTLNDCRRRFRRSVLLVDGRDAAAVQLAAIAVDDAVLLGARRRTSELALVRSENAIRWAAPRFRPRLVVAA